jgi:hypothetical protein
MRANEFLTESPLTPASLFDPRHLSWRPQNFLQKLADGTPFTDKQGNKFYPEEGEFQRLSPVINKTLKTLKTMPNAPLPSITVKMQGVDGLMAVSKFEKADLQTAKGQVTGDVNVQPIGIGIATDPINKPGTKPKDKIVLTTDEEIKRALDANKSINAGDLYNVIMTNKILDSAGIVGKGIKSVAEQLNNNLTPDIRQYDVTTQKKIAIDAGEYLGILALANDVVDFPKKDRFLKFLNSTDFKGLSVIFPGEQNSSLSDSYGVQNVSTGHTIMISSKGGKGNTAVGAAPSLGGLAPSISKRTTKIRKGNSLDFINTMIQVSPTASQGFIGLNWIAKYYPDLIPKQYLKFMPFQSEEIQQVLTNIKTKGATPIPKKFLSLISAPSIQASKGTTGGKLVYVVTRELVNIINNSGLLEKFRKTILELLDENFVQIFTRIVGGKLITKVLWPGKIDGNVALHTKISPGEPGKAGLSFKVTD